MITDLKEINNLLKSKKLYVFDFDGVIADSVEIKGEAFFKLYQSYGNSIARNVINHHRNNSGMSRFKKFEYYHFNYLGVKIDKEDLDKLCRKFSKIVVKKVIKSSEVHGANNFLENLYCLNKKCIIISATPRKEIIEIIEKRNLSKYFIKIYGSPLSKIVNFKNAINKLKINKKDIVYFGDSTADFDTAKHMGIHFVGIGNRIYDILLNSTINVCHLVNFKEIYLI